jgi:hypothetical protein
MYRKTIIVAAAIWAAGSLASCSDKTKQQIEQPQVNEGELITTVKIKAVSTNPPFLTRFFIYKVINGTGNNQPEFHADKIELNANAEYNIEVFVLDESGSAAIDVTPEIISERNAHLFYYTSQPATGNGSIRVSDPDTDEHGQPFARVCKWHTNAAGNGKLVLELIHGPRNKLAEQRDKIAGSTDVEATFDVSIK